MCFVNLCVRNNGHHMINFPKITLLQYKLIVPTRVCILKSLWQIEAVK
jgi:hypothetical protein